MEQREKLIEMLSSVTVSVQYEDGKTVSVKQGNTDELADYLLANGVVVLPCRCGDCEYCDIGQDDVEQWCICQVKRIDVDPTDFCSYAKRKGGDE